MAKILLADDSEDFLAIQSTLLTHAGHEVQTACNGREALQKLEHFRCSLVVTDIMMPHMDGLEFIMELRKRLNYCHIIALTGGSWMSAPLHLKIASSLGAVTTLSKPVTGRQLLEAVEGALKLPHRRSIEVDIAVAA